MEDDDGSVSHTRVLLSSSLAPSDRESSRLLSRRNSVLKSSVRWAIKVVCMVMLVVWGAVLIFFPLSWVQTLVQDWISLTQDATLFGSTGSFLSAFSGPILLIALLAALHVALSDHNQHPSSYQHSARKKRGPSYSLWTFPVVVEGPFGVLSGAELIGILILGLAVVFAVVAYAYESIRDASSFHYSSILQWSLIMEIWGGKLGYIGLFSMVLLFIPIARGSILLRFIEIPFEHATRYHVWLGHLTMLLFTLHGFSIALAWAIQSNLWSNLFSWEVSGGIAILPGVIALACGLLMWVTSLHLVRGKYFELFFYTHYLYIGFVVFLALHVSDFIFSVVLATVLLFMLDRFLRFFQSRKEINVISHTSHTCGVVELVIARPPNLKYNALSFIFVKARDVSFLQWHPFSVSSSPLDGKNHLAVLVKAVGDWTTKLDGRTKNFDNTDDNGKCEKLEQPCWSEIPLTVSVEGPYGHETPYYLMYNKLVLVAGGIGIAPFLAILRDVLHRIEEGRSAFPHNIVVIWAIKTSNELSLLPSFETISPFSERLDLDIKVYVTRESLPPSLEGGETYTTSTTTTFARSKRSGISPLVGTGDRKWPAVYVSSAIVGFFVILALVDEFYENRFDISETWYVGLVFVACMVASVVIFGGMVIVLWHLSTANVAVKENEGSMRGNGTMRETHSVVQNNMINIRYGCRPDFKEILEWLEEKWGGIDVGVIVCGPPSVESSVAKEIRRQSLRRNKHDPIFHFHTHSFEL